MALIADQRKLKFDKFVVVCGVGDWAICVSLCGDRGLVVGWRDFCCRLLKEKCVTVLSFFSKTFQPNSVEYIGLCF
ncbi:hypothetical protein TSAR_008915 [Trichomalopsis sarcophagae]|uniref:Uncharacterized protein n=1 Tax=Trichomalopsis sarcophagae TaxID=543379 RepID=A0A232F0U9_9HYME|nr:hypothetical protein TSAR_008915 [Trichomalopsis sarcophagae]